MPADALSPIHIDSLSLDDTVKIHYKIHYKIISRTADIWLHVQSMTSDMGSANRAMWKSFGVICGKQCRTVHRIPHPHDESWLYFLADVPHLFKNIKAAIVNGQDFVL